MFFDRVDEITKIAARSGTSVFVVPREQAVEIPGALILQPEEKTVITIGQVRGMLAKVDKKQVAETFVLIRPAEKMRPDAANALLKTLEQPGEKVHFVLVTERPSQLLSTILSRAAVYFLRPEAGALGKVAGDERQKDLARQLLKARPAELVALAAEITKKKDGVQQWALEVLALTVEMAYKSYFATKNPAFLAKLPKIMAAYEKIALGGNIKLQIVANLC